MSDDEVEFDRMYRKAVTSSYPMLIIATNIFNLAKLASPFTQETGMKRKTVMLKRSLFSFISSKTECEGNVVICDKNQNDENAL
jgi:hypothetical protein